MTIRRATSSDLEALTALAARTFPLACPPHMPGYDIEGFIAKNLSHEAFEFYLADPGHTVFVDDQLRGYVLIIDESPVAYLSKCYVEESAHGTGVAAELIAHTVRWAREHGFATIRLGVNSFNERALRFYLKQGFTVVGERDFPVGSRVERDHVLERPVTDRRRSRWWALGSVGVYLGALAVAAIGTELGQRAWLDSIGPDGDTSLAGLTWLFIAVGFIIGFPVVIASLAALFLRPPAARVTAWVASLLLIPSMLFFGYLGLETLTNNAEPGSVPLGVGFVVASLVHVGWMAWSVREFVVRSRR